MNKRKRSVLVRTGVLLAALVATLVGGTVALAQSSEDFDLGCRAELTAGGKLTDYPTVGVRMLSSVGQWNSGRTQVQGSGIVVASGYILSVGQGAAASVQSPAATVQDDPTTNAIIADALYLPTVFAQEAVRYVRPCNWPWAAASAAARSN